MRSTLGATCGVIILIVLGILLLFGCWWFGGFPAATIHEGGVICPAYIQDAETAVITREDDVVICTFDNGNLIMETFR